MAKVSSARPSSRQGQETALPTRTARTTRSQSHEPAPELPVSRRGVQNTSQSNPPTPKKRVGRPAKNAIDLDTVDEDAAVEELRPTDNDPLDEPPVDELELTRRTSGHSGISGTTAKTSFSQEEIGELDADVMVDVLPSLATAADELCKLLVPANPKAGEVIRKEIRTQSSKHNKLYRTRLASLNVNKTSFGSTEYIQPSIVLRALLGVQNIDEVPDGSWRPDSVIYKINLASMLRTLLILLHDSVDASDEGYDALARLDADFPRAIAGPAFSDSAFQLCLDILTQFSIMRVRRYMADPTFNLHDTIMNTFYEEDKDHDMVFKHRHALGMMHLAPTDQERHSDAIRDIVRELSAVFEHAGDVAELRAISVRYPWEEFVGRVIDYYRDRKEELELQIEEVGGVDQIVSDLSAEVQRRELARETELKRQSFSRPGGTPKKGFGKDGIRRMKELEARLTEARVAASTAPVPAAPPVVEVERPTATQVDDGWNRLEDDDDAYPNPPTKAQSTARSTLAALQGVQATQRQNAIKGKSRSFIDPQPNATRVSFEDTQDLAQYEVPNVLQPPISTAPTGAPYFQSTRRTPAKRLFVDNEDGEDFEPTQDQGFEVDNRDTTAADQRRRVAPHPQPRASQGLSSSSNLPLSGSSSARTPAASSQSKRQRKNPGSTIPPPLPPLDPDDDVEIPREERMERARLAARHQTVMTRQQKPTQVRTTWTNEEEMALIDLIEEYGAEGIKYAKLKSIDSARGEESLLSRRTAEDLRFKARNMKETFLKGRTVPPRNFDHIALDKKAMDKLHNLGIPYHQERIRGGIVEIDAQ